MVDKRLFAAVNALNHAVHWCKLSARYGGKESTARAIYNIADAAELLGYRLVPITTPQQEHDALLAARLAEDGPPPVTSAPGFDGRDSSIGMREQDIEGAAV